VIVSEANDEMETCNEGMKSVDRSRGILSITRDFIGFVLNGVHETKLHRTKATAVTPNNWITTDSSPMTTEIERWRSQAYANNSRYQIR